MIEDKITSTCRIRLAYITSVLMCWVWFSFGSISLLCQEMHPVFSRILPKDGLNNRYNEFIEKDSRGLLWISSTEGLYQFDGFSLKHVTNEKYSGLLGENIQGNFIEDTKGDLWFTTFKGVNQYIRKEDRFESYRLRNESGAVIELGYNLFFIERDSLLWLAVDNKIYSFNPNTKKQKPIVETEGVRFDVDTFRNGQLKTIIACPWISNSGVQIINFDTLGNFDNKYLFKNGLPNNLNESVEISKAIVEHDSLYWLFSNAGLLALNPKQPEKVEIYNLPISKSDILKDGVAIDDSLLLVTTKNSGLWVFNKVHLDFERNYSINENTLNSLSSSSIREINFDKDDILWLSHFYKPAIDYTWLYNNEFYNPFAKLEGIYPKVNSIIEDKNAQVWCSTENNGVFVFQDKSPVSHFPYANDVNKNYLPKIKQLSLGKDGEIWGLGDHGLYYFRNSKWINYYKSEFKLFSFVITANSHIVISSNKGLYELIGTSNEEIKIKSIEEQSGCYFPQLFPSIGNRFFASSSGEALFIYTRENGFFTIDSTYKINTDIYSIWEQFEHNILWLSTSDGLKKLNLNLASQNEMSRENEVIKHSPVLGYFKDGLDSEVIVTNQNLWIRNSSIDSIFHRYREQDGLPAGQFSLFAQLKDSNGGIWLGTNSGLACFHPDSIKPYAYPSKIYLKNFKVKDVLNNQYKVINEATSLEFKHSESSFQFDVLGITNYHPELTNIHYKLDGYNDKWEVVNNNSSIHFNKVPPGKYNLLIYSVNANNLRSEVRRTMVVIKHPWWNELWFLLSALLVLCVLGYGIFRWMLRRKLVQQKVVFDALQNERNRIADEMHDDLGSGLYSIELLLKGVRKKLLSDKASKKLDEVENKTIELVTNMREIIWAMDGENDSLPELITYIRKFFLTYFDETLIISKAQIPENIPVVAINGKVRRNIFLCVKEAVHNIAKHSEAKQAEMYFNHDKKQIAIILKDNGIGIDKGNTESKGKGLISMNRRMNEINGKCTIESINGTTIILEIPLT